MPRGARDFGDWDLAVREVAGWDAAKIDTVRYWPIRELMLALVQLRRRQAQEHYRHELAVWAALAPHQKNPAKPPKPPAILK
jgi:hypothetical protein